MSAPAPSYLFSQAQAQSFGPFFQLFFYLRRAKPVNFSKSAC
jgi:hypothetical protein